jgi:hypothetical protein
VTARTETDFGGEAQAVARSDPPKAPPTSWKMKCARIQFVKSSSSKAIFADELSGVRAYKRTVAINAFLSFGIALKYS